MAEWYALNENIIEERNENGMSEIKWLENVAIKENIEYSTSLKF